MIEDKGYRNAEQVYRKLLYYFENKIPIHFDTLNGTGWKNGLILDINEKKLVVVIKEFKHGEMPLLCEEIDVSSIQAFREKKQ